MKNYTNEEQRRYCDIAGYFYYFLEPTEYTVALLVDVLKYHQYRYYVLSDPIISDYQYDILYKFLEKLESEHPKMVEMIMSLD